MSKLDRVYHEILEIFKLLFSTKPSQSDFISIKENFGSLKGKDGDTFVKSTAEGFKVYESTIS